MRNNKVIQYGLYFEDFLVGDTFKTEGRTVTESGLSDFVNQNHYCAPLFMDREYLENETQLKRPIIPGLMTVSIADGLVLLSGVIHRTGMALLWMEMDIKAPVSIGDTIYVEIEILEKQETKKSDRGIVKFLHQVFNQRGELVMEYRAMRMILRK